MKYSVTVGSDTLVVELGQPEDPILVDGEQIGHQCADGSCRVDDCIRLAVGRAYDAPIYETRTAAERAGREPGVDNIVVWSDVAYDVVDDD